MSPGTEDELLWVRVFNDITHEIASGQIPRGARIPSHSDICARWAVSRATSARVLAELAEAGWARSEGTRGYTSTGVPESADQPAEGGQTPDPAEMLATYPRPARTRPSQRAAHAQPLTATVSADDQPGPDAQPVRAEHAVTARPATPAEADALTIPRGSTVLVRTTTRYAQDGTPVDHTVTVWPAATTALTTSGTG